MEQVTKDLITSTKPQFDSLLTRFPIFRDFTRGKHASSLVNASMEPTGSTEFTGLMTSSRVNYTSDLIS